jgi:hypothetical protein
MDYSVAMIAARVCGLSLSDNSKSALAHRDETASSKPWRRAPRTNAALAIRTLAIQKVLDILDRSNVEYTQPLVSCPTNTG